MKKIIKLGIIFVFLFFLNACTITAPPLEFTPNGDIINKAIMIQLNQTQTNLSKKLNAPFPQLEISQINIKQIEPIFINKLATYHLYGTYNLTLKYPKQIIKQKNNNFDIYLQRQQEGKTWRLIK
jgi:hypothetical protein